MIGAGKFFFPVGSRSDLYRTVRGVVSVNVYFRVPSGNVFSRPIYLLRGSFRGRYSTTSGRHVDEFYVGTPLSSTIRGVNGGVLGRNFCYLCGDFLVVLHFSLSSAISVYLLRGRIVFAIGAKGSVIVRNGRAFFREVAVVRVQSTASRRGVVEDGSTGVGPCSFQGLASFRRPHRRNYVVLQGHRCVLCARIVSFVIRTRFLRLPIPFRVTFVSLAGLYGVLQQGPGQGFRLGSVLQLSLTFLLRLRYGNGWNRGPRSIPTILHLIPLMQGPLLAGNVVLSLVFRVLLSPNELFVLFHRSYNGSGVANFRIPIPIVRNCSWFFGRGSFAPLCLVLVLCMKNA